MGRPKSFISDEVLVIVAELLRRKSYDSLSMDEIINATGVARQSLYREFGSKSGLALQAVELARRRNDSNELSEITCSLLISEAIKEPAIRELVIKISAAVGNSSSVADWLGQTLLRKIHQNGVST